MSKSPKRFSQDFKVSSTKQRRLAEKNKRVELIASFIDFFSLETVRFREIWCTMFPLVCYSFSLQHLHENEIFSVKCTFIITIENCFIT